MNNFTVLKSVGNCINTNSIIYQVIRKSDKKMYAMKKIHIANNNEEEIQEILDQIRVLASIDSPYIIKYHECIVDEKQNYIYLITEYMDNGNLQNMIAQVQNIKSENRNFNEQDIWKIVIQIAAGLRVIHDLNIMHKEIKPSHILLNSKGEFKIGGFNSSKVLKQGKQFLQTSNINKNNYQSPEILSLKPFGQRTDLFSFGCIIYELCVFQTPYKLNENIDATITNMMNLKYAQLPSNFSLDIKKMINLCLQPYPWKRPAIQEIIDSQTFIDKCNQFDYTIEIQNFRLLKKIRVQDSFNPLSNLKELLPVQQYGDFNKQKNNNQKNLQIKFNRQSSLGGSPVRKIRNSIQKDVFLNKQQQGFQLLEKFIENQTKQILKKDYQIELTKSNSLISEENEQNQLNFISNIISPRNKKISQKKIVNFEKVQKYSNESINISQELQAQNNINNNSNINDSSYIKKPKIRDYIEQPYTPSNLKFNNKNKSINNTPSNKGKGHKKTVSMQIITNSNFNLKSSQYLDIDNINEVNENDSNSINNKNKSYFSKDYNAKKQEQQEFEEDILFLSKKNSYLGDIQSYQNSPKKGSQTSIKLPQIQQNKSNNNQQYKVSFSSLCQVESPLKRKSSIIQKLNDQNNIQQKKEQLQNMKNYYNTKCVCIDKKKSSSLQKKQPIQLSQIIQQFTVGKFQNKQKKVGNNNSVHIKNNTSTSNNESILKNNNKNNSICSEFNNGKNSSNNLNALISPRYLEIKRKKNKVNTIHLQTKREKSIQSIKQQGYENVKQMYYNSQNNNESKKLKENIDQKDNNLKKLKFFLSRNK